MGGQTSSLPWIVDRRNSGMPPGGVVRQPSPPLSISPPVGAEGRPPIADLLARFRERFDTLGGGDTGLPGMDKFRDRLGSKPSGGLPPKPMPMPMPEGGQPTPSYGADTRQRPKSPPARPKDPKQPKPDEGYRSRQTGGRTSRAPSGRTEGVRQSVRKK